MAKEVEYLFSTNNFNNAVKLTGKQAVATLLTRLILMEPGTDPLHPTMGVGIVSKYRYLYPSSEAELKKNIESQISQFLPNLSSASVDIKYNDDKTVNIEITIDDVIYVYDSNKSGTPITLQSLKNE